MTELEVFCEARNKTKGTILVNYEEDIKKFSFYLNHPIDKTLVYMSREEVKLFIQKLKLLYEEQAE